MKKIISAVWVQENADALLLLLFACANNFQFDSQGWRFDILIRLKGHISKLITADRL